MVGTLLSMFCKALNFSELEAGAFSSSSSPPGGRLLGGGGGGASSSESIARLQAKKLKKRWEGIITMSRDINSIPRYLVMVVKAPFKSDGGKGTAWSS